MGAPIETRQTQAVEVAAREGDGQCRATAYTPRAMGGLHRVPGQVPTHPAAAQCPLPPPPPLFPEIAAQAPPNPGVQRLADGWRFREAQVGVPPIEVPPQGAYDPRQ
jgi:hypothetical protein